MDFLYGHDRKLGYLEDETDMVDFLDSSDIFHTPLTSGFPTPEEESYETDWLNSFLDDPVLNDRMMTDAMQPPCIKSEHSYSISDNGAPGSPLGLTTQEDMDSDLFTNTSALDLTMKSVATSPDLKCEVTNPEAFLATPVSSTASITTTPIISPRQPTIIVTTTTATAAAATSQATTALFQGETISFPTVQIKQEPADCLDQTHEQTVNLESIMFPLTPPGSSGSDSDGSQSPQRSAPGSPIRASSIRIASPTSVASPSSSALGSGKPYTQPLFVNPISQSGVLILSEEEKRTLISEGYPIPSKLPLTKQEEKNLKKIRRKIKNKISAQESRRKKKEYLEALEKRVEAYNHENNDLKKKVESLENNNRSLLGQLQKLQSLVSKMPKAASATQTSTALMVVVFCFAVFMGSMSPSTLNIGYASSPPRLSFVQQPSQVNHGHHGDHHPHPHPHHHHHHHHEHDNHHEPGVMMGPHLMPRGYGDDDAAATAGGDPYATPNLKSRVLMSVDGEDYCDDFRSMPWQGAMSCPMPDTTEKKVLERSVPGIDLLGAGEITMEVGKTTPDTTVVMVVTAGNGGSGGMENTSDSDGAFHQHTTSVMPDVTVSAKEMLASPTLRHNMSADAETVA
ncbi:cyclic AMP-responsive element-binding protein 3-like protein 1 [Aplysia californica]|uniref:Cyclic AMP-responsive element-binding protein 3-like protein 1 n=1 Tax=Aplysia californica TaxID=6500 RepID=A0ABM0JA64_APLCA|nr:cyclic AMP-responsive element-binding protein 3-like protein 1 [Aplysia californica]